MKKGLRVCLSVLLVFVFSVDKIHAFANESSIKESYDEVISYYESTSILYLDEIIALGNAGVDVSSMPLSDVYCEYDVNADFSEMSVGSLGKMVLATIFMKEDPTDVNGYDLVTMLTQKVDENGIIEECIDDADDYVWALFACYAIGYEDIEKMGDVLASYQISEDTAEGRENDKGGFNGAWGVSMDSVGLVIEALSIINKERYQSTIDMALAYLTRKQGSDGGYDPNDIWGWGDTPANTDTQCSVIEGLLVYDRDGVIAGMYDGSEGESSDIIFKFQNEDGSFINGGWDAGATQANPISTFTALRALSTYYNGSFVKNAKVLYETRVEVVPPVNEEKPTGPNTKDNSGFYSSVLFLLLSGFILKGYRKKYE